MRRLLIPPVGLVALTGAVLGASCLIDRRTSDFECDVVADCDSLGGFHDCVGGFCVVVDAPPCNADNCEGIGGTCGANNACMFSSPTAAITCPQGIACEIDCSTAGSCPTINCGQASSCKVTCGGGTCTGMITCAGGGCDIDCNGDNTCQTVKCGSGHCDVKCAGSGSCPTQLKCGGDCTFSCDGSNSCGVVPSCNGSCDCDVTCGGAGSCASTEVTCAKANCDSGTGCSSALPGCNC